MTVVRGYGVRRASARAAAIVLAALLLALFGGRSVALEPVEEAAATALAFPAEESAACASGR
ncbi:hypothetical protein AB0I10_34535, partial [Streptomyces sp. NPDC050636]|uniref:hypothetical protein n=1 Tax=Streptomyces sp. NPDC050636 TaxID=3154510 RepID=UPI00342ECFE4